MAIRRLNGRKNNKRRARLLRSSVDIISSYFYSATAPVAAYGKIEVQGSAASISMTTKLGYRDEES